MRIRSVVVCAGLQAGVLVAAGGPLSACSSDSNTNDSNAGSGGASNDASIGGGSNGGASNGGGGASNGGGGASNGGGGAANGGTGTDAGADGSDGAGYTPKPPTLPAPVAYIAGGNFAPLGAYAADSGGGAGISGHAQIVRTADGKTIVQLHVEGLTPGTAYPAHVHSMPCNVDTADGHYLIDPTAAAGQTNEIWPTFTTDADGVGRANITVDHAARPDAQSIVIHDPAASNAKMVCVDLLPEPVATTTATGTFAPFAAAKAIDANIGGTATLERSASGTKVTVSATGLDAGETYMMHVHALPCAVNSAGGHYKIDPTITTASEANELWPIMGDGGDATVTKTHVARPDAQSVVIHRVDPSLTAPPKVACADLVRVEPYLPYKTEGTATLFALATTRGFTNLAASATMTRAVTPSTDVSATISGLTPATQYGVHVHDHSCGLLSGGGHYEIDPTIAPGDMNNEIWLTFTTDGAGAGSPTVSVAHLARPEAASIVIHDTDKERLACIDLK